MKVLVLICLVAAAALVQAYDYSDPSFNALLTEDYLDYLSADSDVDETLNYRAKRELSGPGCLPKDRELPSQRCCKEAIEKPGVFEKIKEVKRECFSMIKGNRTEEFEFEMFSCERIEKKKEEMRCGFQCIVKKQKLFGDDNQFDEKATVEHFRRELNELSWVQDNVAPLVEVCLAEANKEEEKKTPTDAAAAAREKECSKKPMKFLFCMYREFAKKCPVEHQKDTRSCQLIREGKLEFIPHHHHHHHSHE